MTKRIVAVALLLMVATASYAEVKLKTDEDKTLYVLGIVMGKNLAPFDLNSSQLEIVMDGLKDSVAGKDPKVEVQKYGPKIQELGMKKAKERAKKEKEKAKPFLEKAKKEKGAVELPSGVIINKSKRVKKGDSPKLEDTITFHYEGTLIDGTVFDSSIKRGEPLTYPLNKLIPCWQEAMQKMKVGEKAKIVCPSDTAYGDMGSPPKIPGGAALVFQIELLDIK
jgi:FKBP-type peptidyl-prolyl cis-trans isomerase FkpA